MDLPKSVRLELLEHAIQVLGLVDIRHSLIGDEEVRGISGGQRKRVNIGIELVADPAILFLDEPTSGLDSTASKQVIQGVQRVARDGVTVAAVIHQPSYETFCMFDDLILLAKGGRTVYFGLQTDVQVSTRQYAIPWTISHYPNFKFSEDNIRNITFGKEKPGRCCQCTIGLS